MLKQIAQNHSYVNSEFKWYLFGSAANGKRNFSDIDILIIYKSKTKLSVLKSDLESLELKYPLDITFLSEVEEKELNFINTVNAIRLDD